MACSKGDDGDVRGYMLAIPTTHTNIAIAPDNMHATCSAFFLLSCSYGRTIFF